jgi:CubicO group peptidase (beta-lactamase class C family)
MAVSRSNNNYIQRAWSWLKARSRRPQASLPKFLRGSRLNVEPLEDRAVPAGVVFAESTFVPEEFGRNVRAAMDYNFVGYAYAVNYNGAAVVATGTGGLYGTDDGRARTSMDEPEAVFTADTRIEQNSVSKIITAVAVLRLLESQYADLDAALSTPISQFLPSDWTIGPNVDFLTVRHLLTHTSGFAEGGDGDPPNAIGVNFESYGNNNFQNLRALVAANPGIPTLTLSDGSLAYPRSYSNANFSLLAKMIPYMLPDNFRGYLDDISVNDPGSADAVFGELYSTYVRDHILIPSGIDSPSMDVSGVNPAFGYDFETAESVAGSAQRDHTDTGGAFGWNLSAPELARFLYTLTHTETLLSSSTRALMNSDEFLLGWAPWTTSGTNPYVLSPMRDAFGQYYEHGGAGLGFRSHVAIFPGGVEAALAMNSGANPALPDDHLALDRFKLLRCGSSADLVQ